MNGTRRALVGAALTAVTMLALYAASAESGSRDPRLKIKTVNEQVDVSSGGASGTSAQCASGYHAIGGGFSFTSNPNMTIVFAGRVNADTYHATLRNSSASTESLTVNAICVKGKDGLKISDAGTGLPS